MNRSELIKELRRRGRRRPLRLQDLEPRLRNAVLRVWRTMAEARRAAGLDPLSARRRWTEKLVIDAIRRLARTGLHMSQNAVIDAGHRDLVLAACGMFGTWTAARARAGLPPLIRRPSKPSAGWDEAQVIAEILRRHQRRESLAVTKVPRSLSSAACRHLGSWRRAVEAADLQYADIALSRRFDDQELLDWLRGLARRRPRMSLLELEELGGHRSACIRRWGSVQAAARAAGLRDWPTRTRYWAMPRDEVLRQLQARARAGQPLSFIRVRRDQSAAALRHSLFRHFATWDEAIAAAGLPPQRLRRKPSSSR